MRLIEIWNDTIGGNDLTAQAVAQDFRAVWFTQGLREVIHQPFLHVFVVGNVGRQQIAGKLDLGIGLQQAQFRRVRPMPFC
jgi:hypothetical protein